MDRSRSRRSSEGKWLHYADPALASMCRSATGSYMPITNWPQCADHAVAPLCRSSTGFNVPVGDTRVHARGVPRAPCALQGGRGWPSATRRPSSGGGGGLRAGLRQRAWMAAAGELEPARPAHCDAGRVAAVVSHRVRCACAAPLNCRPSSGAGGSAPREPGACAIGPAASGLAGSVASPALDLDQAEFGRDGSRASSRDHRRSRAQ